MKHCAAQAPSERSTYVTHSTFSLEQHSATAKTRGANSSRRHKRHQTVGEPTNSGSDTTTRRSWKPRTTNYLRPRSRILSQKRNRTGPIHLRPRSLRNHRNHIQPRQPGPANPTPTRPTQPTQTKDPRPPHRSRRRSKQPHVAPLRR
jgi:hypothetical protein